MHTLPKHFVRIRHYGFLANSNKVEALNRVRKQLKAAIPVKYEAEKHQSIPCPKCESGILEKATRLTILSFSDCRPLFPHRTHPPPNIRARSA